VAVVVTVMIRSMTGDFKRLFENLVFTKGMARSKDNILGHINTFAIRSDK
jgi:hypothetical protein